MTRSKIVLLALPALAFIAVEVARTSRPARAQTAADIAAKADRMIKGAFANSAPDWKSRLDGDETMALCSKNNNNPTAADAKTIEAAARASIKYPADGKLVGDWKLGERIAQSGYGMRFTDYPAANPNGGNCYACHQMTKEEVSYGTIGPSLLEYGKIRKYAEADIKASYDKIYNSHAVFPCSLMPRFGSNGVLSIEQVVHLNALLMSADSPVNK
jgi:L-cysteine S-thiosulfotransferase